MPAAPSGKRNVTVWRPSVCLFVCPSGYSPWLTRGSMRRGQRTFRPYNKEDGHTCSVRSISPRTAPWHWPPRCAVGQDSYVRLSGTVSKICSPPSGQRSSRARHRRLMRSSFPVESLPRPTAHIAHQNTQRSNIKARSHLMRCVAASCGTLRYAAAITTQRARGSDIYSCHIISFICYFLYIKKRNRQKIISDGRRNWYSPTVTFWGSTEVLQFPTLFQLSTLHTALRISLFPVNIPRLFHKLSRISVTTVTAVIEFKGAPRPDTRVSSKSQNMFQIFKRKRCTQFFFHTTRKLANMWNGVNTFIQCRNYVITNHSLKTCMFQ